MSTTQYSPPILSQSVKEFVRDQVAERGLHDEAEYYERLAEAELRRKIWAYYEREVEHGLETGESIPASQELFDEIIAGITERCEKRRVDP